MNRKAAEDAGMGQPVMAEGHENDLDVRCVKIGQPGLGADKECLRLVGDTMKNRIKLFAIGAAPQLQERKAPELLEEERVGPRACDSKWKAALGVEIEHERVGQHAADRAGVDIIALRGAARAPQSVSVGIEFDRGSELHFGFSATDRALRPGMGRN
jgi:hypothetical protein